MMGLFPNDLWFDLLKVFIKACWANILSCFNKKQLKLILSLDFLGTIDQERNYYKRQHLYDPTLYLIVMNNQLVGHSPSVHRLVGVSPLCL